MVVSKDVRGIVKEELCAVMKGHDKQHKDILNLIRSNIASIIAIENNTAELIKLHHDAKTVIEVSRKAGVFVQWIAIPVAGLFLLYNTIQHAITHTSFWE